MLPVACMQSMSVQGQKNATSCEIIVGGYDRYIL